MEDALSKLLAEQKVQRAEQKVQRAAHEHQQEQYRKKQAEVNDLLAEVATMAGADAEARDALTAKITASLTSAGGAVADDDDDEPGTGGSQDVPPAVGNKDFSEKAAVAASGGPEPPEDALAHIGSLKRIEEVVDRLEQMALEEIKEGEELTGRSSARYRKRRGPK